VRAPIPEFSQYCVAGLNKGRINVRRLGVALWHWILRTHPMPDYQAYFVGHGDQLIGRRGLDCRDDGEAIEEAKEIFEGPTIEVWCGARLITRINHKSE
jgi:hypothetical protein